MYLRMHVLIKYFSRRNHRHESIPRTRILWGSVRISIPTLIVDCIYQWAATCAWTCSLYMSSVILTETLLSPCIRIRTCPQREQNNFMTEFSSQVSLSSKMIWLTFFIVTCRSKRVLAKNVSPIAWSYSPTTHLHLAHNVFMGSSTRAPVPPYLWTGLIYRLFVAMDIADDIHKESRVIDTGKWKINQDLHIIRAHQLYYTSLLDDARKTIEFIRKHKNPAMDSEKLASEKELNDMFLERECDNLILEIDRLTKDLEMQQSRLKNVVDLVCSVCSENIDMTSCIQIVFSMNISDNKAMRNLAFATLKDSAVVSVFFSLLDFWLLFLLDEANCIP